MKTYPLYALFLGAAMAVAQADDFTEVFTTGETRDLPAFYQMVLTPDGSADFYSACQTTATSPTYPVDVDEIAGLADDGTQAVNLPGGVTIPFFGTDYSTFYINANGNITFGSADAQHIGSAANHFSLPRISAAFTDLWPNPMQAGQPVGFVGWRDLGDRVAVVWFGVPHRQDVNDLTYMTVEVFHSGVDAGKITITATALDGLPDAADVVVGVSEGGGVPAGFTESDISAYPICGATPEIAELFDGSGGAEDVDLANTTLCFTYGGASVGYVVARQDNVFAFPTDPAGGTNLSLGDDGWADVTLGNSAGLHGSNYLTVGINANGWLRMLSGTDDWTETLDEFFAQPAIAALWRDLDMSASGTISWKEIGGRFVVTWENVPDRLSGAPNSFQIEMWQDGSGRVDITYLNVGSTAAIAGLSSGPGSTPAGFGETDLSSATLKNPIPTNADFGDLPDLGIGQSFGDYATTFSDGGPSHVFASGIHLGATMDIDADGQPNERANGDDVDVDGDDDDGVVFLQPLHEGFLADIEVTAASPGFLNAWIDFDGDGSFSGIGEQIAVDLFVNIGTNTINLPGAPSIGGDLLYSRFRFTSDDPAGGLGPDGAWGNGEVEDYALSSISGVAWIDDGREGGTASDGIRNDPNRVPGVVVSLRRPGDVPVPDADGNPIQTMTDGEGRYRFAGLPAGDYVLHFDAGALPVAPPNVGLDDSVDSDVLPTGSTASVIVDEGRCVKNVDAGYLLDIGFALTQATIDEQDIAVSIPFPAVSPLPFDLDIPFVIGGTASDPADHSPASYPGPITMPKNTDLSGGGYVFTDLFEDTLDEFDETVTVTLGDPGIGVLGPNTTLTVVITDDDEPPTISVAGASADEGNPLAELVFTVSIDAPSGKDITFTYETIANTADEDVGSGGDYLPAMGSITIPAGQTQIAVPITISDDALDEDNETLRLLLTGATNATLSPTSNLAIGFIIDDDLPPTMSIANASAVEGAPVPFHILLDAPSGRDITVEFTTSDVTAGASDYAGSTAVNFQIPKGSQFRLLNVFTTADGLIEGEETFTLSITNAPSAEFQGVPIATGRIFDAPTIAPAQSHAWSATAGWQNWNAQPVAGVVVGETVLSGYVWCAATGWLCLGDGAPSDGIRYSNSSASDFGVNHSPSGELSGQAWSATTGWLVFEQVQGRPKIDRQTGAFSGHAWSPTTGWLRLDGLATATISIVDTDGDGIDDGWERVNFGNSLSVAGADTDADNDGASDRDEWISGTDPNDPADLLSVSSQSLGNNTVTVTFPTDPNRRYSISVVGDLGPNVLWADSGLGIFAPDPGSTTTKTITVPDMTKRYFFRLHAHTLVGP